MVDTLAVALVPLLVVTQWLALRYELPTRFWFNAVIALVCVLLFVTGWKRLPTWLRILGFVTAASLVLSWLLNQVAPATVLAGTFPYAVPVVAAAAGFASPLRPATRRLAASVHTGLVIALATLSALQLLVGEQAYRWFGQDLDYPRWWERGRATGLVVNPGRLAQVGLLTAAIAPIGKRVMLTIGLSGALVAFSGGRIGVAAAVVVAISAGIFWKTESRRWLVATTVALIVALVVVLAASPATRDDFLARTEATVDDVTEVDDIVEDARVAGLAAGVDAWRNATIVGWGPGRFGSTTAWATQSELHDLFGLPDLRSEDFVTSLRAAGDDREIDVGNAQLDVGWLQALAETGLLGTASLVVLLAGMAYEAWRRSRTASFVIVGLMALFSLTGPGIVDPSLALVALWWAGTLTTS